jgi:DNA-binding HxlR family transcriptional regulator
MKDTVSGCPIEDAMRLLSGRWRTLLIYYLSSGAKRFSELRRDNPKISQRILTLELRTLETAGVISRTVYRGRVANVQYELTKAGRKLLPLIDALGDWWEELQAQQRRSNPVLKVVERRQNG